MINTLEAIDDEGRRSIGFALTRSRGGVFEIIADFDPDEDAPAAEQAREAAWQLKVATMLVAHGNAKITHEMFAGLLAEQLQWRRYVPQHAAKYASAVPAAAAAKKKR